MVTHVRNLTFLHTSRAHACLQAASWPNFVSIGLRNEPRFPFDNLEVLATYNWDTWYTNMVLAANTINAANPNPLIFFAGLDSDITIYPIPPGSDLGGGVTFVKSDFAYANKLVLELHNYMNTISSCDILEAYLYESGFNCLNADDPTVVNVMPMVMSEFGYAQDQSDVDSVYATCLKGYLPSQQAGWMVWSLAGSYYIRQGVQDEDESYGESSCSWIRRNLQLTRY